MAILSSTNAPNSLQWDFVRVAKTSDSQLVHYYDTYGQELYTTASGLKTITTKVINGSWQTSEFSEDILIDSTKYTDIKTDHPTNGTLYLSAKNNQKLEYLRYQYMVDISNIIEEWDQQFKNDSSISDMNLVIKNIGPEAFSSNTSVFIPGSKIDFEILFGSATAKMGVYWIDDISYNPTNETVNISCRNYSGHWLNDQTLDELGLTPIEAPTNEVVKMIFDHAGVTNYIIQPTLTTVAKFEFSPSDTILQALSKISDTVRNPDPAKEIILLEYHTGGLLYGARNWMDQYMVNSYYTFDEGQDVFARDTSKCLDGAYSRIMVTGEVKNSDPKSNHTPIIKDVLNFSTWYVKCHKTKHITAPTPMTLSEFQAFADAQALAYQYVGISEDFTGPYRPLLYIGDIAEIKHQDGISGTSIGLINQIKHSFSVDEGFKTEFVVDSGGIATEGSDYVIYSASSKDNGKNRKMNIVDVIKILSK